MTYDLWHLWAAAECISRHVGEYTACSLGVSGHILGTDCCNVLNSERHKTCDERLQPTLMSHNRFHTPDCKVLNEMK